MTESISVEKLATDCEIIIGKLESLRNRVSADRNMPSAVEDYLWRAKNNVECALKELKPTTPIA